LWANPNSFLLSTNSRLNIDRNTGDKAIRAAQRISRSLILNKVSDLLLSPKTTLPALLSAAGAPVYLVSLLVPIRESCALLPQALYAKLLSSHQKRHRPWQLGMLMQLVSSVIMLIAGLYMQGLQAGLFIIAALIVWSLSRALCSLTNKDIQGKHIKQGDRGKLLGSAGTISALITVLIALFSLFGASSETFQTSVWFSELSIKISHPKLYFIGLLALLAQMLCIAIMWPLKTHVDINQPETLLNNNSKDTSYNKRKVGITDIFK
jgi:hypothetical protein